MPQRICSAACLAIEKDGQGLELTIDTGNNYEAEVTSLASPCISIAPAMRDRYLAA
jgi:hypothetical protein